ncbi:FliA/WhiG family RNA polymerase sigma factor [Geosporobacter ferrireducens]|uniref:RNA polymerase sigma factor n=1 Tax=Geosporobacter ferrireducens TaxID=1424294 RepID=A0A1D8GBH1_9FIRM|nr:FliA/WhiG family RNA polymerase sigma factor [Geosporobacter ferrireducens]AOT68254.1 RNA polymerase subunit sigma [Geosporobacter ferrireducens]MTI57325.1 FliA/WhiG family RNA polymerase sigma factor [Geosporobacter ferrireducens]
MDKEVMWEKYAKSRDKALKDQLIVGYVDLVKIIAGRLYTNYGKTVEFDDLVSYGIFGLIDAIEKFDPTKNVKFETYAYIRVRGAIIDQLRNLDWIPRSVRQKHKKLEDIYKTIENEFGRSASDEEVAERLGVTMDAFNGILSEIHSFTVVSLEEKVLNNSNFSIIDDDINSEPQTYFEQEELKSTLIELIQNLPERERKIITLYYYSELTYKEISTILGVSESRISQLHTKAVMKLRGKLEK